MPALVAGLFIPWASPAAAQPVGGKIVAGSATITAPSLRSTLITQSSAKAIIDWQHFSLANGQSVQFAQPDASSITLNRVTGGGLSVINGSISANGQVWLINPNGVLFGSGAGVNVGGLLATTSDIANGDFLSGSYVFSGAPAGSAVVNKGVINAGTGGSVVLSAPRVVNKGVITAHAGHVALGSATAFTVDFNGDHLLSYQVTTPATGSAPDGTVAMTERAARQVKRGVVNDTGMTEASHARIENGEVILDAGVTSSGAIDVSDRNAGQVGGTVELQAGTVTVTDGARIDASGDAGGGTVLVGGNFHGAGPQLNSQTVTVGKASIKADAITSGNGGNVAIYSTGTTRVAAAISAQGGAQSGDGGQVETSGHTLSIDDATTVTTAAIRGTAGDWLLDPAIINIQTGGVATLDGNGNDLLANNAGQTDNIAPITITNALQNGNVRLEASSAINVNNDVTYSSTNSLTLLSQGAIYVNSAKIQNTATVFNGGSIVLVAGWDGGSQPTGLASSGQYGLNNGTISISGANAAVGAGAGGTYLSAYGLSLQSGSGTGQYAQVGLHGNGGGDIAIQTLAGGVTLSQFYANTVTQIGNGGFDGNITGAATGNITITTTGNTDISVTQGAAAIRNAGGTSNNNWAGNVSLTTNTLTPSYGTYNINNLIADAVGTSTFKGGDVSVTLTSLATLNVAPSYNSPHNVSIKTAGDLAIGATSFNGGGNLTLVTPNSIDVGGAMTSSSAGRLTLMANGSITANASIQNSGAGDIVIVQGWDKTSPAPTGLATVGTYGLTANSIWINGSNGNVAVGSAGGNTYLSGYALLVSDGSNATYGQLGYHGAGGGNIAVQMTGGNIDVHESYGGTGTAQIGNGSYNGGIGGLATGNITITVVGGNTANTGYLNILNADNSQYNYTGGTAAIGNYADSFGESGNVTITAGRLTHSGINTYDVNTLIGSNIGTSSSTGGDVSLTLTAAAGTTINALSYASPHNVSLATNDAFTIAGAIANTGTGSLSLTSASSLSDTSTISLGGAFSATVTSNSSTISFNNIGNAVSGAVLLNTALGDASFNNSIATTLGAPVADDNTPSLYNFVVNGSLTVKVAGGNTPTLTLNGRLRVKGTGDTTLQANGDLINNNGNGTIYADHLNLISDAGGIGTGSWTFGDGSQSGGTLNLFLSANNGAGIAQINPGDVNFGGTAMATAQGYGVLVGNLLVFGNGLVQQDAGVSGILRVNTLDVHAAGNIALTNTSNDVTGTAYFRTSGLIGFNNSVNTTIGRANGGGLDVNNHPNTASAVTIVVADPSGHTLPSLTLAESNDPTVASVAVPTSIDSSGAVALTATGAITDSYTPAGAATSGHVTAASLSVTSSSDAISLRNPINNITYDGTSIVSLIAAGDIGFVNSQGVLVQASSNGGSFNITTNDANSTAGHSVIEIFQASAPGTAAGPSLLHASGNIYNQFAPGPNIQAKSLALVSDNGAIGTLGSPIQLSPVTSGVAQTIQAQALGDIYLKSFQAFAISNQGFTDAAANPIGARGITTNADVNIQITNGGNSTSFAQVGDGAIAAVHLTINDQDTSGSIILLDSAANRITGQIQLTGQSDVTLANSISTLMGNSSAGGVLKIVSSGNLTIDTGAVLTSAATGAGAIVLGATGNFINNSGSGALTEPNGAFQIFSHDPSGDTFNGLDSGNSAVWNTTATAGINATTNPGKRYAFAIVPIYKVTASNVTKTNYGDDVTAIVAASYTVSGLQGVSGAFQDSATGTPSVTSTGSPSYSAPGSYGISVALGSLVLPSGYAFSPVSATLTVVQPTLTYVANPFVRTYGAANPTFSGIVTGFQHGDTQTSSTTGTAVWTSSATPSTGIGHYAINGSGLSSTTYQFTQDPGNATALTIAAALLSYVADTVSRDYGAANPVFTGKVTGFVNGESQANATTGTLSFSSPATVTTGVGRTAIIGSGLSASNYVFTQAGGNSTALTINPATLSYVATAASKTYGAANPVFGGTVVGFVNGDTQSGATTGTLVFGSSATNASGVGSYAINGSGLAASNYTFTQKAGNSTALTISPATLSYVAATASRAYGAPNPFLTGSVTGFVNGDTQSSATTGSLAFNSPATATNGVGNYAVNGFGLSAGNYVFAQAAGNSVALTINPATLSYVANATSRTYGAANPVFTGTVTGFQNNDTQANATTGTLTFLSTATTATGIGAYAINGSGLSAQNYVFVQSPANTAALIINQATLSYVAGAASKTYGAANPLLTGTVTGFVNGDTQASATSGTLGFSTSATFTSGVGSYAITGNGLSAGNYLFAQAAANGTALTINPATLTYAAGAASKTYGAANPVFAGTVTGFQNGDTQTSATTGTLVFASAATSASGVGSYGILGSGLSAKNYIFAQATANSTALTVTAATLTAALTGSVSKTFDGTTTATLSSGNYLPLAGLVNGDAVSLSSLPTTGTFDSAATGTGKVVTVTGLTLAGAGNYVLASSTIFAPIGVILAATPVVVASDPVLLSVTVTMPQAVPVLHSIVATSVITPQTTVLPSAPIQAPQVQVAAVTVSNPIETLIAGGADKTQPAEPAAPADTATNYVIDSVNGATTTTTTGNSARPTTTIIIPGLLHAAGGPPPPPPGTGENLSAWGNSALWQ